MSKDTEMIGYIRKLIPFSSVDGPGNRFAIFLQGCMFNCWYCHNPETIGAVRNNERDILQMRAHEVMDEIRKVQSFIRGITASGGECTLQKDFLIELFFLARAEGLSTLIDSNGVLPFKDESELLALTDGVMLDVKAVDEGFHRDLTGISNRVVLENLEFLARVRKLAEVRTVISGSFDNALTVRHVAKVLAKIDSEVPYKLIKYRPHGVREAFLSKLQRPTDEDMAMLEATVRAHGVANVVII